MRGLSNPLSPPFFPPKQHALNLKTLIEKSGAKAYLVNTASADASGSVAAAAASASAAALAKTIDDSALAEALMPADALKNQRPKTHKRIRHRKPSDGGVIHWSSNLGLDELFWMCPPDSQESYANICLVVQIGKGDLNMRLFLQISNFQVCHTLFQILTAFSLSFAIRRLAI